MVTIKRSNMYTNYALESFFRNTELDKNDEFFLIDNDGCEIEKFLFHKNASLMYNRKTIQYRVHTDNNYV